MTAPIDTWMRSIILGEVFLQLPFFFYVLHGLLNPSKVDGKGMFRSLCMVYGAHTSTTLIPILACHATNPEAELMQKIGVISIYLPYLIFPLWLVIICVLSNDVFDSSGGKKLKTKEG